MKTIITHFVICLNSYNQRKDHTNALNISLAPIVLSVTVLLKGSNSYASQLNFY